MNFMISAFEFGWMNPWWANKVDVDGRPDALFPEAMNSRSQDLEHLFCPTGAIWMAKCRALTQAATFYGPDHRYHVMPWDKAIDIDDYGDDGATDDNDHNNDSHTVAGAAPGASTIFA